MTFGSRTPESLLPRSDSKNPATTCKGITANGRPCRRSLASSPKSSPSPSPGKDRGVLAVLRDGYEGDGNAAAAFYCWQHKDQAEMVAKAEQNHTELFPVQERNSIDTLMDRVGVVSLKEDHRVKGARHERRKAGDGISAAKEDLPADWQRMQGPLMSVPCDMVDPAAPQKPQRQPQRQAHARRSNVKTSLLCCVRDVGDDQDPPIRHRPKGANHSAPKGGFEVRQNDTPPIMPHVGMASQTPAPSSRKSVPPTITRNVTESSHSRTPSRPTRPSLATTPECTGSQTTKLLSLIPSHLSPQTTSTLLSELSKPISSADMEGYIYMFWLTPESHSSKPGDDAASDLLETPSKGSAHKRRETDVLQRYASQKRGPSQTKTVLLKIGRAENVHRRLSQWSKQCSYNITLIRYYPYASSSARQSDGESLPRKVPHVHRVERLVHVELTEKRVTDQGPCQNCGQEHREWFEIEASRDGLRAVDEVIRRWVAWAERLE